MDKKIYELAEFINKDLEENNLSADEKQQIAVQIKALTEDNLIVIAQTNPVTGDIEYNAKKAQKWINWADLLNVKAIVFPELFLVGGPLGDYITKFPVIAKECKEWLDCLAKLSKDTKIIIGFIEEDESELGFYNSVAVLQNGKIEKIIRKSSLNDLQEAHDSRYFLSANAQSDIIKIGDKTVNIAIGDDIFNINTTADYVINIEASISRTNKEQIKHSRLSQTAKKYNKPLVYVNQVGSSDCLSYDGSGRVYNSNGELIYRAKSFEEQFFIVSPFENAGQIYPLPAGAEYELNTAKEFSLDYEHDMERTYKTVIQAIKDYFKKTGFMHACLGLSGGLDSTVCAVLLADALGKENVFGISMPSKITTSSSKNDAKELAQNLGIHFLEIPIKDMFDSARSTFDELFAGMEKEWNFRYKTSYTNDNIQARSRATILWGIANEFEKCLTIATSDKSEAYMGYATINGDMTGAYAPIADVTKTKLFALAKWMNMNREQKNAIPQSVIEKRPGAELAINPKTGKPLLAEEALMPYEFLDEVIWRVENLNQSINDMIDEEFLYEKNNSLSKEQKLEWLRKFFRRMSNSAYKGTLMPPSPIVDAHSINKAEYTQPVNARINYEKTTFDEKLQILTKI